MTAACEFLRVVYEPRFWRLRGISTRFEPIDRSCHQPWRPQHDGVLDSYVVSPYSYLSTHVIVVDFEFELSTRRILVGRGRPEAVRAKIGTIGYPDNRCLQSNADEPDCPLADAPGYR